MFDLQEDDVSGKTLLILPSEFRMFDSGPVTGLTTGRFSAFFDSYRAAVSPVLRQFTLDAPSWNSVSNAVRGVGAEKNDRGDRHL